MDFKDILQADIQAKRKLLEERAGAKKFIRRGELEEPLRRDATARSEGGERGSDARSESDGRGSDAGNEEDDSKSVVQNETHGDSTAVQSEAHNDDAAPTAKRYGPHRPSSEQSTTLPHRPSSEQSTTLPHRPSPEQSTTLPHRHSPEHPTMPPPHQPLSEHPTMLPPQQLTPNKTMDEALLIGAMETEDIKVEDLKGDPGRVRSLIALFLKRLLREQGEQLSTRPAEVRATREGKLATAAFLQGQDHLKALFKLLRKNALPVDVLTSLAEICGFMQHREYVRANDAYLKLAIGNAPWPIGVTAVGIHERSSQEKIKSNQVAHVLNDEASRKWIQAVKRLMTFCQSEYPSAERSKMMG